MPTRKFRLDRADGTHTVGYMFSISGTVKEIFPTQTFDSGFSKREFVVTTEEDKYPQDIVFECLKDKTTMVDELNKGDAVTVSFDIRGREWKGRYFVNLAAWKIENKAGGGADPAPDIDDREDYSNSSGDEIPF